MTSIDQIIKRAVESSTLALESHLAIPIGGLSPRPDQITTAAEVIRWLAEPASKGKVVEMPTGAGKTILAQMVIRWLLANTSGFEIAFLVSRKELLLQTKASIERSFGPKSVNITQGSKHTNYTKARVRVLMEQTIASKVKSGKARKVVESIERAGIVFIDECHHTYYQSFIDQVIEKGGSRLVGLSATPDDWRLLPWWEQSKILGIPQIALEIMTPPVLATPVMLSYSQEANMKREMSRVDSISESEKVRYRLVRSTIASEIRQAEMRIEDMRGVQGQKPWGRSLRWLIKVTRVEHAKDLAAHLTEQGIQARAFVSGKGGGSKDEIDRIFAGRSHHRVAIVVHRFTVGYDHPGIQGLIFTNETGYPSFVQSIGRVLRTGYPPQKDQAYILDMAGNWSLHKEKYLQRRKSPEPLIPMKIEREEADQEGAGYRDGLGRPDAETLGHMVVLTLPGIQNTDCGVVDKAIVLAWCTIEARKHIAEKIQWYTPQEQHALRTDPATYKRFVLKRALASYWFATGTNLIPHGPYEVQRKQALAILHGNPDANGLVLGCNRSGVPEAFTKRLKKARRAFSKKRAA